MITSPLRVLHPRSGEPSLLLRSEILCSSSNVSVTADSSGRHRDSLRRSCSHLLAEELLGFGNLGIPLRQLFGAQKIH